ncbi:MAG: RNA 2',3'-cyclic phosphodiesterase [Alphaproteobacteria bacterium]
MRLFVGIQLPEDVRARLKGLAFGLPGARWISPENLHVTLRFIGEVDGLLADDIGLALGSVHAPGFHLTLKSVGQFGRGHMAHTVWAGIEPEPALVHLHDKIATTLVRIGLQPEHRKFTPHVTLARLKKTPEQKISAWAESLGDLAIAPFPVDGFQLFRSYLGSGAAHYQVLSGYPLKTELL